MKILLVSESPVAGTIVRFASALNDCYNVTCVPFVLRGYKSNSFDLPLGVMGIYENWAELLIDEVKKADAIVIHNVADQNIIDLIGVYRQNDCFIGYHYHSPPFEAPLHDYNVLQSTFLDAVFCVAQGHSRFFENPIAIANIIEDVNIVPKAIRGNAVFVGHLRTTDARWSRKVPKDFMPKLAESLKGSPVGVYDIKKTYGSDSVTNSIFINGLQRFEYVVDDVCSGLFHQTSLEALKAGAISFSAADEISLTSFCQAADCPPPPFELVSHPDEVSDKIKFYSKNVFLKDKLRLQNFEYSSKYLRKERLEKLFIKRLSNVIGLEINR